MEELKQLEHLSLVSKICTELDNHLGLNDKDLAEFIIALAEKNQTFADFKKVLIENGAEFPDSFITNLLRIIQLMKPPAHSSQKPLKFTEKTKELAFKFPGLAIANDNPKCEDEDDKKNVKHVEASVADDMMAQLESFAPKTDNKSNDDKQSVSVSSPQNDGKSRERRRSRSRDRSRSREHRRDNNDKRKMRPRSRSRRDRSRSKDRKRHRSPSPRRRSRSPRRSRSRERRRRSPSPRRRSRSRNRRSRSRGRDDRSRRNRSPQRSKRSETPLPDDPEPGKIYSGRVANIVPFGCFVQILGLKKKWEGLVHISQLRSEGRVVDVTEVVSRGQTVKVKVMSIAGQKVSLSMKEVDQDNGEDLNPASHGHLKPENDARDRNPDRPVGGTSMLHLQGALDGEEDQTRKRVTRISSPERWEIKQMISSGVIDRSELPDFDDETGLLPKDEDDEADIEIEIVEEEPPFLQGHGRALNDLSPVRIVKNPDGSLAQAAMMQSALAKERREQKMLQREQEMDTIPTSLNKNWIDPLPDGMTADNEFKLDFFFLF